MEYEDITYEEIRRALHQYYESHELVMVGMNDYANGKHLLNMLKKEINAACLTVDAGSLTLNKSEHMDIMLGYNLTLEEIKIARLLALHDGISNFFRENMDPKTHDKIEASILTPLFNPAKVKTSVLDRIGISDLIRGVNSPIIIHSTGANNLMKILGTNPYVLNKDEKNKNIDGKFYYALVKATDPKTIRIVLDGVERNFDNILTINPDAKIFSLGLYLQKIFLNGKYKEFRDMILSYNDALEKLCEQYKVKYIDTFVSGMRYPNHGIDFNLSKNAQLDVARMIVESLADMLGKPTPREEFKEIHYEDKNALVSSYEKGTSSALVEATVERNGDVSLIGVDSLLAFNELKERDRERKIYEKTLKESLRRQNLNEKNV